MLWRLKHENNLSKATNLPKGLKLERKHILLEKYMPSLVFHSLVF
jgi:hypothetical protein